jgi:hypothetical protein
LGKRRDVGLPQFLEGFRKQEFTRMIGHDCRQIANSAIRMQNAWLFFARRTLAQQFHFSP